MKNQIDDVYMIQEVGRFEKNNNTPEQLCLTSWFGDYGIHELKLGVSDEQVIARFNEIMAVKENHSYYDISVPEDLPTAAEAVHPNKVVKESQINTSQKNNLDQINNQIMNIVETYKTNPETISDLLVFREKFYKYSVNNTMLVQDQNPNATFVQSYAAWEMDGYNVLKGQKGLKVLVPTKVTYLKVPGTENLIQLKFAPAELKELYKAQQIESCHKTHFKVGNVFDISQTNVPKENYPQFYSMGYQDSHYESIISGLVNFSNNKLNCPVFIKDLQSIALRGCYYPLDNSIELNTLLESSEKISTLTHELGHAILHNDPELKMNPSQVEFEADCMSMMLESHLGIHITDSRKSHIATHYKNLEREQAAEDMTVDFSKTINDIFKRYESIIDDIDTYVQEVIKNQELDQDEELNQPTGNLVSSMLNSEYDVNIDQGLEYALEA